MTEHTAEKRTDYTGVIIGLILLPVFLLFMHLDKEDMGRSVCVCLGMIMLAIRIRWDLRKRVWFWGTFVLVLVLHIPLFLLVKWPHGWLPAAGLLL